MPAAVQDVPGQDREKNLAAQKAFEAKSRRVQAKAQATDKTTSHGADADEAEQDS